MFYSEVLNILYCAYLHHELSLMDGFTFDDPDEFRGQLADVTCDMWITGMQQRRWAYDKLKFSNLVLQRGDLGSGNLVHGQASPNGFLVYIFEPTPARFRDSGIRSSMSIVKRALGANA